MASELATRVIGILSPTVGDFVARAKVTAACKLAKVDFEHLEPKDLAPLAEKIADTCAPLGAAVAQNVKAAVLRL